MKLTLLICLSTALCGGTPSLMSLRIICKISRTSVIVKIASVPGVVGVPPLVVKGGAGSRPGSRSARSYASGVGLCGFG